MLGAVMHAPGDVRVEERERPTPTGHEYIGVVEGYRAMDERRAIKVLLRP